MDAENLDIPHYIHKLRKLGVFIQDLKNNKSYPNTLWEDMGYKTDEMKNMGFLNFVHPDDKPQIEKSLEGFLENESEPIRSLFRMQSSNGEWRWILSTCLGADFDPTGKVTRYLGHDHDVTEEINARKQAENALQEAETLMSIGQIITSQLSLPDTINAILHQAVKVISFTSATVQLLKSHELEIVGEVGFETSEPMIGKTFLITDNIPNFKVVNNKEVIIVNENLIESYRDYKDLSDRGVLSWMGVPLIYKETVIGMIAFDHNKENMFTQEDRRMAKAYANQVAIALENARLYDDAKNCARKDYLTDCFTRRHFYSCLRKEREMAKRYKRPVALIIFDIDDFKIINDTLGHLAGDEVLKSIVSITSSLLRKSDTLCRFGGEEFIILMPSINGKQAYKAAERIREKIHQEICNVTVSLGCTSIRSTDYENEEDFINRADQALYTAKNQGKNRSVLLQ